MTTVLPTFETTEIISASAVDPYFDQLRNELLSLQDELVATEADAVDTEARIGETTYSAEMGEWAVQHLQLYLDGLVETTRRELRDAVDAAVARAAARRAEAQAEADARLNRARAEIGSAAIDRALDGPAANGTERSYEDDVERPPIDGATALAGLMAVLDRLHPPTPSAENVSGAAELRALDVDAWAAGLTAPPAESSAPVIAQPAPEVPSVDAPAPVADEPAQPAPVVEPEREPSENAFGSDVAQHEPEVVFEQFWQEGEEPPRKGVRRFVPLEALLPIVAAVILLVVVLAWVG